MSDSTPKVAVVPCSGIGKPYGTVSRVAACRVTEDDRPGQSRLVPLALLVKGDEECGRFVVESPAITIDGCPLACATKVVQQSGCRDVREYSVMEVFRHHRELKPQGIAELNEDGEKLAEALAQEVAAAIDKMASPEEGGKHA